MLQIKPALRIFSMLLLAFVALVLTACGGGGGGGGGGGTQTQSVGGGGVKGPLANAVVTTYAFNGSAAGFKGAVIDTGTTGPDAKITGLNLTLPLVPPYILEFTSDAGTTDITTGVMPVITTMRTVLTQALLDTGEDIYATPLTTMATDIAVANADSLGDGNGTTTAAEFIAALPVAASQVMSTLGFGIDSTIDIFDTPPLVDDTTDTIAEQTAVAAYRAAIEALTAIVYEMDQQSSGTTPDAVLAELTSDLAADGLIDGMTEAGASTILTTAVLNVLSQDPATLPIPNSDDGTGNPILVADVEQILIDETAITLTTTDTAQLDPTTGTIDTVVAPAETNSDIDGDGVLNANDAFPNNASETADTDGDGVGDNADAFPNNATETADTDGDGVGDNADVFPNDASETVDTDGDGVGDNSDNCPTVANPSQADVCGIGAALDATGVWDATVTITNLSPLVANGCANKAPLNTVSRAYLTMTQTGTSLVAKTVWGDSLSGSIDAAGAFTLNGVTTWTNPFSGDMDTDTLSVTGTLSSATAWSGTVTTTAANTPSGGSLTNLCTETASLASAFVYKHVASEDYSGVYGLEGLVDSVRVINAVEVETSGASLNIYSRSDGTEVGTLNSYEPATGFFSIRTVKTWDNAGGSQVWTDNITGIFVRAPGDGSGPQLALAVVGYGENFSGSGGTGAPTGIEFMDVEAYGKQVSTQGFTRSIHYRPNGGGGDNDDVFMGLQHPPLKGDNTNQYLEVLDTDGSTRLCAQSFDKRYRLFNYLPAVDMATEQFQSKSYSAATCNTFSTGIRVVDSMNYTVRMRDMGADGVIDGGDDTTLFSQALTAALHPTVFTEKPSAGEFALNGAAAPLTMKRGDRDGAINLFGFFDVNEDMVFSWTNLTGADLHQVQIVDTSSNDAEQARVDVTASASMATIPAGTLDMDGTNEIRLRAIKTDTGNGGVAYSNSKWLLVSQGIKGLFNVELGGAVGPAHDSFQLWMMGDMGDGITATLTDCENTSPNWTCNSGTIDYTTNTVSLNMTDDTGSLGTVVLDLTFTDSANATVSSTSAGLTLTPAQTHVRLANPGLAVRSLQPSGGVSQQTMAVLFNVIGGGDLAAGGIFDKATFKRNDNTNFLINGGTDTGVSAKVSWCEASGGCGVTKPFLSVANAYQERPTDDGVVQKAGNYMSDRSNSDWGLGAGLLDGSGGGVRYKSVWSNSTNPTQKWAFKVDYTAPDASVLVTPIHNQVTVNLTGGDVTAATGVGEVGTPIDVSSQPVFGLTWTGTVPTGGEWQIRVTYIGGAGPFYPGAEVRSAWMTAADADLTDNGNGTWTWTNGDGIALSSGDTVRVQIRARDGAAFTMLGAQRTGTTDDRVYLTMP